MARAHDPAALQLALVERSAVVRADVLDSVEVAVDVAQQHLDGIDDDALRRTGCDFVKFRGRLGHAGSFAKAARMTRSASILLALLLAAPILTTPAGAATRMAYKAAAAKTPAIKPVTLPDGLKYTDVKVGKGPRPRAGQTAIVHYTGTLLDGKKFDSSRDRGQPFEFVLGGRVIPCWNEAVATMHVGGRRKLVCPPALAYGEHGYPPVIPPNATLNFDVELLGVR